MSDIYPRSTVQIGGHPIHSLLVPFPIVCFIGTLVTDLVYAGTAEMMWADFSAWLLTVGLLISILVVIAGLVDFVVERRIRALEASWIHAVGNAIALVLAIFDAFVHTRDAYTSVVPAGLVLSFLVVAILVVSSWFGCEMVYRHGVAIRPDKPS